MVLLPGPIELDDLVQCGLLGLLEAAGGYRGVPEKFQDIVAARIRGAMLKGLAASDCVPPKHERQRRHIRECTRRLEQELTRAPTAREIATALGLTVADYQRMLRLHHHRRAVALHTSATTLRLADREEADPFAVLQHRSTMTFLVAAMSDLSRRDQLMLRLRYRDALKLDAIGALFGVSESRVCQRLRCAVASLRKRAQK
jgi:RNA polymerase sigma factor for flagellar operon FliA